MLSIPPAMAMSMEPAASASPAMITVCIPLPHTLFTVVACTVLGRPAFSAAWLTREAHVLTDFGTLRSFGATDDLVLAQGGRDILALGAGRDVALAGRGADTVFGGSGNDNLSTSAGDDVLDGGIGNDSLEGGDGTNQLSGGADNDSITSTGVGDVVDGGTGIDFASTAD